MPEQTGEKTYIIRENIKKQRCFQYNNYDFTNYDDLQTRGAFNTRM